MNEKVYAIMKRSLVGKSKCFWTGERLVALYHDKDLAFEDCQRFRIDCCSESISFCVSELPVLTLSCFNHEKE